MTNGDAATKLPPPRRFFSGIDHHRRPSTPTPTPGTPTRRRRCWWWTTPVATTPRTGSNGYQLERTSLSRQRLSANLATPDNDRQNEQWRLDDPEDE
jgi:hypothetical protein